MMRRAMLVDCGVVVKTMVMDRRPFIEVAIPKSITINNVESMEDISSMKDLDRRRYEYCFCEGDYDVYLNNTKIIPTFLYSKYNHLATAIKFPDDYKTRIEDCLYRSHDWIKKLMQGQEVPDGAVDEAIKVIAQRIVSEICL